MQSVNIISELSTLSKLPNKALNDVIAKEILCIGSAIHDALLEKEDIVVINIGPGTLSIELSTMQCKFVPNKELKATIKRCLTEKIDPVEMILEQSVIDKLLKLCEEVN